MRREGMDEFTQMQAKIANLGASLESRLADTSPLRLYQTLLLSEMEELVGQVRSLQYIGPKSAGLQVEPGVRFNL